MRRSSARATAAAPRGPLSWWLQTPRRSTLSPLIRRPLGGRRRRCGCRNARAPGRAAPSGPRPCRSAGGRETTGGSTARRGGAARGGCCRGQRHRGALDLDPDATGVDGAGGRGRHRPVVAQDRGDLDDSAVVLDPDGRHPHPVGHHVQRFQHVQPHRAVQSRPRVPAGVAPGAHLHPHTVRGAEPEERGDVDEEPGVAVGAVAGERVIDEHLGVPHGRLELQHDAVAGPFGGDVERLEIGERAGVVVRASARAPGSQSALRSASCGSTTGIGRGLDGSSTAKAPRAVR